MVINGMLFRAVLGACIFALPLAAAAEGEDDYPPKPEPSPKPAPVDDGKREYPYELLKNPDGSPQRGPNGGVWAFRKSTGDIIEIGIPGKPKQGEVELSVPQEPPGEEVPVGDVRPLLDLTKENHGPIIDMDGGLEIVKNGFDPGQISDASRNHVRGLIAMYAQHIRTTQAIQVSGDRIEGLVTVTNRGARSIEVLELTLLIPIAGGSVESHRILLDGREGRESPPPPKGAAPKIIKLEMPAPGSVRTSQFEELKVTYIKFAN